VKRCRRGVWLAAPLLLSLACRTTSAAGPVVRQVDVDGDGRTDRFEVVAPDGSLERSTEAPRPGSDPDRVLVVAIDAVRYEIFADLQREGLFKSFFPASRMVAPFPSLTNISFTALLKTRPSAAYEDRFYDPVENRIGGGMRDRLTSRYKEFADFHSVFDWEEPHLWGGAAYFVPERVSWAELLEFERQLESRDEPELVLYLGSPDPLGHMLGRKGLEEYLRHVDRVLEAYLAAGGGARRVVLFSDHGMSDAPSRLFDLDRALEDGGFNLRDRIESPKDVVAPAYGLVGSIQLYTWCGNEEAVARAVAKHRGVDFAVWLAGDSMRAVDRSGDLELKDRPSDEYPNLIERVHQALTNHTQRPASVLVSLDDGYHYGSRFFDGIVSIQGTHGSARYTSSVGFLASNVDRTPEWLPAEEVYPYLGLARPPESEVPVTKRCYSGPDGAEDVIDSGGSPSAISSITVEDEPMNREAR
jgi:hypothetical protein